MDCSRWRGCEAAFSWCSIGDGTFPPVGFKKGIAFGVVFLRGRYGVRCCVEDVGSGFG